METAGEEGAVGGRIENAMSECRLGLDLQPTACCVNLQGMIEGNFAQCNDAAQVGEQVEGLLEEKVRIATILRATAYSRAVRNERPR